MNCLIILLLLFCGGCQNNSCCCNDCKRKDHDKDCDCEEKRRKPGHERASERRDCDCEQGEPAAWREGREGKRSSYPSISGCETCGCDPE